LSREERIAKSNASEVRKPCGGATATNNIPLAAAFFSLAAVKISALAAQRTAPLVGPLVAGAKDRANPGGFALVARATRRGLQIISAAANTGESVRLLGAFREAPS